MNIGNKLTVMYAGTQFTGKVIDETRNMFRLRTDEGDKMLVKDQIEATQ